MKTEILKITDRAPVDESKLKKAAEILRTGGLVAFPTETVYGLGGNALDAGASKKIYAAKGRPSDNPLIVHISCMEELPPLVKEIPESARKLAAAYWPGPMTLILPKSGLIPDTTSGGLPTVAVRMPSDPVANALIRIAGVPVAAPSANTSGRPSPTSAAHVIEDMNGRIEMIIDGGDVPVGVESTIVDLTGEVPVLLRPGAVTLSMLESVLGTVELDRVLTEPLAPDVHPKAPGMKYRHYAPKADMLLVEGPTEMVVRYITARAAKAAAEGKKVGIIATDETVDRYPHVDVRSIGRRSDERTVAFHREVLNLGSMSAYFENPRAVIADFSDEGSVDRNDPAYNLLVLADNAVRRELNMNFIEQDDHGIDAVEQLLNDIYSITARLFGTDQAKLETYIAHARAFVEAHPDARVSLLEG